MQNIFTKDQILQFIRMVGRGLETFDYPAEFEPILPVTASLPSGQKPVDDGRIPSFLGRLFASKQPIKTTTINAVERQNSSSLVTSQHTANKIAVFPVYLPVELKISYEQTEHMLLNLANSTPSFTGFEAIGLPGSITFQFVCPDTEKAAVLSQLKNHLPTVDFREEEDIVKKILTKSEKDSIIVDFGLKREFFYPISFGRFFASDSLIPLISAFEQIENGEIICLQVLFSRTRQNWQKAALLALTDKNGKLLFGELQNSFASIKEKLSNPLFAVRIRLIALSSMPEKSLQIARRTTAFFRQFSSPNGNELVPLQNQGMDSSKLLQSVLHRTSFRSSIFLSERELSGIVHLPTDAIKSEYLRRKDNRTKEAPAFATRGDIILGENHHAGERRIIRLSDNDRRKHIWLMGATGSGKTSLINFMIEQDLEAGNGLTFIEPHGDAIENILRRIPEHRIRDVIFVDPLEEVAVGFNILQANSEEERNQLSSDLVAIFRRFSTSWGDVINSLLHNAILAFLSSSTGGTLVDLKHFLVDAQFRQKFLETVEDEEIRFYWQKEFPQISGRPHAPLLTRLDLFLRSKIVRNVIAQRDGNLLDFRRIMDERKILLLKLTHGAIGEENAHLLGSIVMTKLYQAALSRQNVPEEKRPNHFIYSDESHQFIVPSLSLLLSGGRAFSCSVLFSHQETRQVTSRNPYLLNSLQTNCFTRICFRTDSDADFLAKGFSYFTAEHLRNLGVGEAIVRLEQSRHDFNLKTFPLEPVNPEIAEKRRKAVVEHTRKTYAVSRSEVEEKRKTKEVIATSKPLKVTETTNEIKKSALPPASAKTKAETLTLKEPPIEPSREKATPVSAILPPGSHFQPDKGNAKHQYLTSLIKRMAESRGFLTAVEKEVFGGLGRIDLALEQGDLKIACEISVTTPPDYELQNIRKCLTAGYNPVLMISADKRHLNQIKQKSEENLSAEDLEKVLFFEPEEVHAFLENLDIQTEEIDKKVKGFKVNVKLKPVEQSDQIKRNKAISEVILEAMKRLKK